MNSIDSKEKTILVTGVAGYIGSHAAWDLLSSGYRVVGVDCLELPYPELENRTRGYLECVEELEKNFKEFKFEKINICDSSQLAEIFNKYSIDAVLHFAALVGVDESVKFPELYFKNNTEGLLNVVQQMELAGVNNLVFSSTAASYKDVGSDILASTRGITEDYSQEPSSPYGESKLRAEKIIKDSDLNYAILRYFNVCGANSDGIIGDSKKPSMLLVQNAVRGAMGIDKFELTFNRSINDGEGPIRDYIDVRDLVRAHRLALEQILSADYKYQKIYNLGTGKGLTVMDIVRATKKHFSVDLDVEFSSTARQGEMVAIYANPDKAKSELGFKADYSVDDSMEALKKWYVKHPNGWQF